jgi:hypothetical protein
MSNERWVDESEIEWEREQLERMYGEPAPATTSDAVREHVRWVGGEHPDSAWILSPFDTWEPNPLYRGARDGIADRHPEDERTDEEIRAAIEASKLRALGIDPQDPCLVVPSADDDILF